MGTFDFRSLSELGDPEVERIGWGGGCPVVFWRY